MRYAVVFLAALATMPWMSAAQRTPILLELFTSEGCSSCPPADRLLEKLDREQATAGAELIVLSEHVDYWNHLGWVDPFSSPIFSKRQREYADRMKTDEVYTPQLIVDGTEAVVGNDAPEVATAIQKSTRQPKSDLAVTAVRSGDSANVTVQIAAIVRGADLMIIAAQEHAQSAVIRGENSGHSLSHVAVAYSIQKLDPGVKQAHVRLKPGAVRVIAFLQERASGKILAAAQTQI